MNMDNNAPQKEYWVCMLILVVLTGASLLPVLSGLALYILLPACLAYLFVRFDWRYSAGAAAVVLLVPMLVMLQPDVSVFLICVPLAAGVAFAVRKKKSLLFAVSAGVAGELVSVLLLYLAGIVAAGGAAAFHAQIGGYWSEMQAMMDEMFAAYQIPSEIGMAYQQMFLSLVPAIAICMAASFSYLAFYFCNLFLKRRDVSYVGVYRPFSEIKADKSCVVAVIVFFIISLFASGIFARALVNLVVILAFFLFVCGFSTACFFVKRIRSKPVRILVFVILFMTIFITSYLFMFVGFIDAFLNIRRIGQGPKPE